MRKLVYLFAFMPLLASASVDMTRVNPELFIHEPQTDLGKITVADEALKRTLVSYLFDHDLLNHEGTRAFSREAEFGSYYKLFQSRYRLIDLDRDGVPELLFEGFVSKDDEREHVELYRAENGIPKKIYDELGHILAYKIQPNTQEILLFHHQYPCCLNASHNLNRLRLVEHAIQSVKRYFLGRDTPDMKGKFFPDKVVFTGKFKTTKSVVALRWSGEVIVKDAWIRRAPENLIAHYDKGAIYTVLGEEHNWYFVLMHTAPKQEANGVVNPANLQETAVYGWLDKRTL